MTHAELLRRDAELAMREGGMYYSGQYLRSMAYVAESLEADNAKLRELVRDMWQSCPVYTADCYGCEHHRSDGGCKLYNRMRELGIEVGG